jgi:hypothetical protein
MSVEPRAPVFVVGAGRSGTTLLRSLLSAHSALAMAPETHFLALAERFGMPVDAGADARPADPPAFWAAFAASPRIAATGVDPAAVRARAEAAGGGFRAAFGALLTLTAEKAGKPRSGEKTPGHHRFASLLLRWFPDARVIFVRRDPRAVAASALEAPWVMEQRRPSGPLSPFVLRTRWFHVDGQARGWRRIYGARLDAVADDPRACLTAYEDLVRAPEAELTSLCAFLGLDYEPAMTAPRAEGATATPAAADAATWRGWGSDHERRAAATVSTDGLERWRARLSAVEIAMVEARCGALMPRFGYAPITGPARLRAAAAAGRATVMAWTAEKAVRRLAGRQGGRGQGAGR